MEELHQNFAKSVGDVSDQAVFVAADIEDGAIIANEVNCIAEVVLDIRRSLPIGLGYARMPRSKWGLCIGISLPELAQRSPSNDLHSRWVSFRGFGGKLCCAPMQKGQLEELP